MAQRARSHVEESQPQQRTASQTARLTLSDRRDEDAMNAVERAALITGRLMFGGYFVYSGIRHFKDRDAMIGYAKSKGVRWPTLAVLGTGAMLIAGGLSLVTGVKPKLGAGLVTGFLAGVTPQMHDYWNADDRMQRMNDKVNFTKNLALIGGAAFAAASHDRCPWRLAS